MSTATRTTRAIAPTASAPVTNIEVELKPKVANALLAKIAEAKRTRLDAEKAEKEAKQMIRALLPSAKLQRDQRYVIRVRGAIRAVFNYRCRTGIDTKLLLDAFPEAYAACESTTEYEQFNAA